MTNPNNAVGTNAAYNGRTSVDAFSDVMGAFSGRGVLSGWNCVPGTGMTVQLGGDGSTRDAAIAEDNAGNRTSVNNISGSPVEVAIAAAPATGNRIDLIVAYVDNPPTGVSTEADNLQACGIIDVTGTAATNPTAPTETAIRNAITADGATGASAYYVVLAQVRVGTNVTSIGSGVITQGARATLGDGTVTSDSIDFATLGNQESHATAATTLSSTTWQSYLPLTATAAGRYIVFISARFDGGSTIHDCLITTLKNGSATGPQAQFYGNQTGNISGSLTIATHTSVELAVGDTVALGARVSAGSTSLMSRSIALVRIG